MSSARLESEQVVVSAPMSFAGSAQRIWKMTDLGPPATKALMVLLALFLIVGVWGLVLCWYVTFGLLLVPYRLLRRGSRKRRVTALQHREQLSALADMQQQQAMQTSLLLSQQTATMQQQVRGTPQDQSAMASPPTPAPISSSAPGASQLPTR